MPTVADVIQWWERFAPPALAANWDNTGLLLGDRRRQCRRVMTCLTLTPEVANEAVADDIHLIMTHHPILFRGVKRLTMDNAEGRTVLSLAQSGVAVYSPHTSFDNCANGINDRLAARLGLIDVRPLRATCAQESKLVVFVPETDLAKVSDAIFAAGAGVIGQYRECSFRISGTGTFFGSEASNPVVGKKGQREVVQEWRLEAVCPNEKIPAAIRALKQAHSYEEPAFDVYPLAGIATRSGEGRIGELPQRVHLADVARLARRALNCEMVQVIGDLTRPVTTVALACGAAGEFLPDAIRGNADAFLTGEMRFHDYLSAQAVSVGLILPGHYATERFAVEELSSLISEQFPQMDVQCSRAETDPVHFVH